MVDESPAQAGAQVLAQSEARRRRAAGGKNRRTAIASGIDRDEKRLLSRLAERIDVVGDQALAIGAGGGTEQVSAPAARPTPQVDEVLTEPAIGERAPPPRRLGVRSGD